MQARTEKQNGLCTGSQFIDFHIIPSYRSIECGERADRTRSDDEEFLRHFVLQNLMRNVGFMLYNTERKSVGGRLSAADLGAVPNC